MKKVLSLVLVFAMVLTVVGSMGVTVSAAGGNTVYTETFTTGTVTVADGSVITTSNYTQGGYTVSGLNDGFGILFGEENVASATGRIPKINKVFTVYMSSSKDNYLGVTFPAITEGKAKISFKVGITAGSATGDMFALADSSNGIADTKIIVPLKTGKKSVNGDIWVAGENVTKGNGEVFHIAEGNGVHRTYSYYVDVAAKKWKVEFEKQIVAEGTIPDGLVPNTLYIKGCSANGVNLDKVEVIKYGADSTVTFQDANGGALGTATISGGQVVGTVPTAPEVANKTFCGWADSSGKVIYDLGTIEANTTLKAAYADNKIVENFSNVQVTGDAGNYGIEGLAAGLSMRFGDEYASTYSSGTKRPPSKTGDGLHFTFGSPAGRVAALSFPEIKEGSASIEVTISNGATSQSGYFAALADAVDNELAAMIAPLKRGKFGNTTTNAWLDMSEDILLNQSGDFQTYKYNVDMSTRKYTFEYDGVTYGPYDIPAGARVNSLWFDLSGATDNTGITIKKLEITKFGADSIVTFNSANGTALGTVKISNGQVVGTIPTAPAVAGKVFAGWVDANGQVVMDLVDITKNTTLTASYVDKVIEEDFENLTVNVDPDTDTVSIAENSGLEFVLGGGKFQGGSANKDGVWSYGATGSALRVLADANNRPDDGNHLGMFQIQYADSIAVKFPAVQEGTVAISFDGNVGMRTQIQSYFGALAYIDGNDITTAVDLRRGRTKVGAETAMADGTWLNNVDGTSYRLAPMYRVWHTYTYIVNMTAKTVTVKMDDEVIVKDADLPAGVSAVNALRFAGAQDRQAADQESFIDNIRVEYDYKEAPVGVATIGITDVALAEGNVVVTYGLNEGAEGNGAASITGMPIAALYKDGALEAVTFDKTASVTLNAENATKTINVTAPSDWATNSGDYTVKVFIWNAETLAPQINVAVR